MLSYCLRCRKNKESENPKIARIKNGRIILLSKRARERKTTKSKKRARATARAKSKKLVDY